jgi:hypothetical protein
MADTGQRLNPISEIRLCSEVLVEQIGKSVEAVCRRALTLGLLKVSAIDINDRPTLREAEGTRILVALLSFADAVWMFEKSRPTFTSMAIKWRTAPDPMIS